MHITIFGTGYVGLTTGADLASRGHSVTCVDVNAVRIAGLVRGVMPFFEDGLEELVRGGVAAGTLRFTTDGAEALADVDVALCAVGTPLGDDGKADLRAVRTVAEGFAAHAKRGAVFVVKSTVPVGTGTRCQAVIGDRGTVASNPEFLSQGTAVRDTRQPTRIVVGAEDDATHAVLRDMYASFVAEGVPYCAMSRASAEAVKCAANAFLATKISFINEIASYAHAVGADVEEVARGIGLDPRIGPHFLRAGLGYGGGCLSKDVQSLIAAGRDAGYDFRILPAVEAVNDAQRDRLYAALTNMLGGVAGKRVAVWGLSFKPGTDDVRNAPSLRIVGRLLNEGASVVAYDPQAMDAMRRNFPSVVYAPSALAALDGADALVVLTEWDVFRHHTLADVAARMRGNVVLDGRNLWHGQPHEGTRYWSIAGS